MRPSLNPTREVRIDGQGREAASTAQHLSYCLGYPGPLPLLPVAQPCLSSAPASPSAGEGRPKRRPFSLHRSMRRRHPSVAMRARGRLTEGFRGDGSTEGFRTLVRTGDRVGHEKQKPRTWYADRRAVEEPAQEPLLLRVLPSRRTLRAMHLHLSASITCIWMRVCVDLQSVTAPTRQLTLPLHAHASAASLSTSSSTSGQTSLISAI